MEAYKQLVQVLRALSSEGMEEAGQGRREMGCGLGAGGQGLLSPGGGIRGEHSACALVDGRKEGTPSLRSTPRAPAQSLPSSSSGVCSPESSYPGQAFSFSQPRPLSVPSTGCCCFWQTLWSAGGAFQPPFVLVTPEPGYGGVFYPGHVLASYQGESCCLPIPSLSCP